VRLERIATIRLPNAPRRCGVVVVVTYCHRTTRLQLWLWSRSMFLPGRAAVWTLTRGWRA